MENPIPSPENKPPLIRASELAQYGFCHRAWWLRAVQQQTPANQATRQRGMRRHLEHAAQVKLAKRWRQGGRLLMVTGLLLLMTTVIWFWLL